MRTGHKKVGRNNAGFTLIELMMVVFVSAIVALVLSAMYQNQRKLHKTQEAVVDMQQNARAALYLLGLELRMAGYDPLGIADAGLQSGATSTSLHYTQDHNADGDTDDANENIRIYWDNGAFILPMPGDKCTVSNPCLRRDVGGGAQPFINNIDFFDIVYWDEDGNFYAAPPAGVEDKITRIQLSMLVRSSVEDTNFYNNLPYESPPSSAREPNGGASFDDGFRRRMITTTIQLRNADI